MSSHPPSVEAVAAAAPRQRGWLKWVGCGCGCLVLAIAAFVGFIFLIVRLATAAPEKVVTEFLAAAGAGNYEEAYEHFAAPLQAAQSRDDFRAAAQANAVFFKVRDTSFSERSLNGGRAKFSGTATLEAGTEVPASFELVRENDEWKLIAYRLGSP